MILKIHCDGGSRGNPGPGAAAFVVLDSQDNKLFEEGKFLGKTTNNEAEYQAVLLGLEWLLNNQKDFNDATFVLDSQLVTNQLQGIYAIREKRLTERVKKIKSLQQKFPGKISFICVPRSENKQADLLVNRTLDNQSKSEN